MELEFDRESQSTDHNSQASNNTISPTKGGFIINPFLSQKVSATDFEYAPGTIIGTGSYAQVFKAIHKKTERTYALKIIDKTRIDTPLETKQINQEIEILSHLNHPHIVRLLNHFEDSTCIYILMPYLSQGQVFNDIQKNNHLNDSTAAQYAYGIIDAVSYLHSQKPKIIHRDIKPENLLLDEDKRVMLTDFGTSTYLAEGEKVNDYCGSPEYLAPEIIKGKEYDERVDVWSIGILLFEMLAGHTPFAAETTSEVFENINRLKITWPYDMSPLAKNLIMKILKIDPDERITLKQMKKHPFIIKWVKVSQEDNENTLSAIEKKNFLRKASRKESLSLFHKKSLDESLHPLFLQIKNELDFSRNESIKLKGQIAQLQSTNEELLSLTSTLTDENNSSQNEKTKLYEERKELLLSIDEKEDQLHEKDLFISKLQHDFYIKEAEFRDEKAAMATENKRLSTIYNELRFDYNKLNALRLNYSIEDFQVEYEGSNLQKDKQVVNNLLKQVEDMFKEIKSTFFEIINADCKEIKAISTFYKDNNEYIRKCYLDSFTSFNTVLYQMKDDVKKNIEDTLIEASKNQTQQCNEKVKWLTEQNEALSQYKNATKKYELTIERLETENKSLKETNSVLENKLNVCDKLMENMQKKITEQSSEMLELKYTIQNMKEEFECKM